MTVEALVAGGDPFEAVMARSRAELKAVLQQTEAARATLAALQATLAATQKQVADLQAKAADLSGKVADAEKRAGELVNAAKTEAGVIRARRQKRLRPSWMTFASGWRQRERCLRRLRWGRRDGSPALAIHESRGTLCASHGRTAAGGETGGGGTLALVGAARCPP